MANSTFYSGQAGNDVASSVDINDTRRKFNFGDRVAELAPMQSPFFVYLSKVAKKATNDPVFKFLEQRHQWQRRNFEIKTADVLADGGALTADGSETLDAGEDLHITCMYDEYGRISSGSNANFVVPGIVLAFKADDGSVYRVRVADDALAPVSGTDDQAPAEGGTALSSDNKTYRAAVRTKSKEREDQITACSDTAALDVLLSTSPTIRGSASNGATEKKKGDGSSYDPKQWNDVVNSAAIKAWPTE